MKRQINKKYSTKFSAVPKRHVNAFPFGPAIDEEALKMPAYSSGSKEYKPHFTPLRDPLNIDPVKLMKILNEFSPCGIMPHIKIDNGICSVFDTRFRYKDIYDLLEKLREEKLFKGDNNEIKKIRQKYYE